MPADGDDHADAASAPAPSAPKPATDSAAAEEDRQETREWLDSLDYVYETDGPERVQALLQRLQDRATSYGVRVNFPGDTPYINTIPISQQPAYPGDRATERRLKSYMRWNAMAMVVRANREDPGIGGHISTYASAATLYEVALQPLLPRQGPSRRGRHDLLPGACLARYLRARLSRRTPDAPASRTFPSRTADRRRHLVVSAPVVDADVLGVSRRSRWDSRR